MTIDFSAHIYELTEWVPRKKDVLSPFSDKYFRQPLNSSTSVCVLGELNGVLGTVYIFFATDGAARRVMVVISRESTEPLSESDARGVLGQFVGPTKKEPVSRVLWTRGALENGQQEVSIFLRESRSLVATDFLQHGRLYVASDAKGIAVIDTTESIPPQKERAQRLAVLTAMAFAYQSVLDDAIDLLAEAGRKSSSIAEEQLREWSQFMSSFYFHEPIKLSTIELARFYGSVRDRHKISNLAQEVTDQLKLLAEIVRLDRSELQASREKTIQRRIGICGLLLAFVGAALTFAQVTPKTLSEASAQWGECARTVGVFNCMSGEYKDSSKSGTPTSSQKPPTMFKKPLTRQ